MTRAKQVHLADVVGRFGQHKAFAGYNYQGEPMIVDRMLEPHTLISGRSGGGKGGLAIVLQLHDVVTDATVKVLQPKAGENGWLEGVAEIGTTPESWIRMLAEAVAEAKRRQDICEGYRDPKTKMLGLRDITYHPDAHLYPPIRLYLDELSAIIGQTAKLRNGKVEIETLTNYVTELAARGRSALVGMTLITQRPTIVANFAKGDAGGAVLSSVPQRIHFDRNTQSLQAVFDHCDAPTAEVLNHIAAGHKGRCIYAYCDARDEAKIMAGQVIKVEPVQARPFAIERIEREGLVSV